MAEFFGGWARDPGDDDQPGVGAEAGPLFQFMAPGAPQQAEPAAHEGLVQHGPAVAPLRLDLRDGLMIPGVLHVFHNITEDFDKVLQEWGDCVRRLRHLTRFLVRPWSRQRLVAT